MENGMPDRDWPAFGEYHKLRPEMKFVPSALIVTSLMAFNAFAQPTPPPAATQPASAAPGASGTNAPRLLPPSMMNRPPGLMPNGGPGTAKQPPAMPDKDKLSYALGFTIGSQIKRDKLDLDLDTFANAIKDVLQSKPTRFDEKEVHEVMTQFQGALRAKMAAEREKDMAEAKAKADEYLAKNAKDPDVKTLPDGLQYKVLKDGSGPSPKPTETVTVSYKGRLIDGTAFDQNDHFQTPVTGRTIKGWSEILPLMKVGSKWEVSVPPELGYGTRGQGKIPANSALIFEMELLSIAPPSTNTPPTAAHPMTPVAHPGPGASTATPSSATPVVSGQIIKVPSKDEMAKGAKIEVITNPPSGPPPVPPQNQSQ
jgi:FKBP-type peptidyl-prolyl cis-trans isomerase FklB